MEYEEILFGLQPLINAPDASSISIEDVFLQSYLTVLDQLAVHLRAPSNRNLIRETGLLTQLLRVLYSLLDHAFHQSHSTQQYLQLSSEFIRCVANALIDNDKNRELFWDGDYNKKNEFIDYYAGRIFGLTDDTENTISLQSRTVVLISNLTMDDKMQYKRIAPKIQPSLMKLMISMRSIFLEEEYNMLVGISFDLLSETIEQYTDFLPLNFLVGLSHMMFNVCQNIINEDNTDKPENNDDEVTEEELFLPNLAQNIAHCIFIGTCSEKYNFSDEKATSSIQHNLLKSLNTLNQKNFENQLITNREILSSIGNISSNLSYTNEKDILTAIDIVKSQNEDEKSPYAIASALIILSNYISNPEKADEIRGLLDCTLIINSSNVFKDPIQFQGFLTLLRKLLKTDIIMFTPKPELERLAGILVLCYDQSKYYQGLKPLLEKLLEKLLAISTSKTISDMIKSSRRFYEVISDGGIIASCQTIDKLSKVQKSIEPLQLDETFSKILNYHKEAKAEDMLKDPLSLFHILRSVGIYLTELNIQKQDVIFENFSDQIMKLLEVSLSFKSSEDSASKAVWNNARYLAGIVIASKSNTIQDTLKDLARRYF